MTEIIRFGVSLEKSLLDELDRFIKVRGIPNRSQGIRLLIREALVKKEWHEGREIAGAITLVYNHHKRELLDKLTTIQHEFHHIIISTQHIHLDHDNCLEIVVVKGKPKQAQNLLHALESTKGIKHAALNMTTTGRKIP